MDYSPPDSSIHGILQARVLEWVAISFSRGSSWPRNRTLVSRIAGRHFTVWATRASLSDVWFTCIFLKSVELSFNSLDSVHSWVWWGTVIFSMKFFISGVISKKPWPTASPLLTSGFSYKSVMVVAFIFRSLIHFVLTFIWCEVRVQLHSVLCGYQITPTCFVEEICLSLNCLQIRSNQSLSRVRLFATHESQHTRPPWPSPTPGVHWDSRPSSQRCHPAISSSVVPFSSCPQSLPASESLHPCKKSVDCRIMFISGFSFLFSWLCLSLYQYNTVLT